MNVKIVFPKPDIINVPTSGKLWDFTSRTDVYVTTAHPTLIINFTKEEFKMRDNILKVLKKVKRIGSYSYEVEFEGRKYLAKIKVGGREINIDL